VSSFSFLVFCFLSDSKMQAFVEPLRWELPDDEIERLLALTPANYTGYAAQLAREV